MKISLSMHCGNSIKKMCYLSNACNIMKNMFLKTGRSILSVLTVILIYQAFFAGSVLAQQNTSEKLTLPEFIAHRGASYLAPENTLASIQLAWEIDADAVEFDVFLAADGEVVVHHDKTTDRTGSRDKAIEEQTLDELRELDFGAWKGSQWKDEKIITLDKALATLPKGKRMVVEAKSGVDIIEPMLEVFDRSGHHPHQIVFITFSYEVAAKTKQLRPQQNVLWLSSFRQDNENGQWSPTMDELVEKTLDAGLDGLNLRFIGPATSADEVAKIRDAGLGYFVWTVNDVEDAEKAIELGVDGLTTDRPAWMKKQLLSRNGWELMSHPQK